MQIVVVTPGGPHRPSITVSLITFIFCCMIVMGAVALLLGFLFQLLVLLSPFLVAGGLAVLKVSVGAFVVYRIVVWLWRLVLRPIWTSSFLYRHDLFLQLRSLLRLFVLALFR